MACSWKYFIIIFFSSWSGLDSNAMVEWIFTVQLGESRAEILQGAMYWDTPRDLFYFVE